MPEFIDFSHPNTDAASEEKKRIANTFRPYLVHAALAPNFQQSDEKANDALERAFNIDAQFIDAGAPAESLVDANDSVVHAGSGVSRGFALKLDGSMLLDSKERIRYVLAKWDQSLGTSMYEIKTLPESMRAGSSDEDVARVISKARSSMPDMISPSHRIVLARTLSQFDGDKYVLFVTANDVPAARQLEQYVAARATRGQPLMLRTLARSPEYATLHERSQCARDTLAAQYAKAIGAELQTTNSNAHATLHSSSNGRNTGKNDFAIHPAQESSAPKAVLTSVHYTIVPANDLAHGVVKSTVPQPDGRQPEHFVVYNDATPAFDTTESGAIISHGILGGYSILKPDNSMSWQQARHLSLLPANATPALEGHTKMSAAHRNLNERSLRAADTRIVWRSDFDGATHPALDEQFISLEDPYAQDYLSALSPRIDGSRPVQIQSYSTVAGQLPSITTAYASPETIGALARQQGGPNNIVVALDNDAVVCRITQMWDSVVRPSSYPLSLQQVFANTYEEGGDGSSTPNGFRLLRMSTACTNKTHKHSLYGANRNRDRFGGDESSDSSASSEDLNLFADSEDVGIDGLTGQYRSLTVESMGRGPDYWRQMRIGAVDDIQTMITLDKQLLRLICN